MLPKNLSSSYQQYKNDTDSIASYLATTAKRYGYVSESKSKSAKKRAKARNTAGPAASDASQSNVSGSQGRRTYTIAIKDFTVFAEFVAAQNDPPVQVSAKFASLLDRAIATREWFAGAVSPHLPDDAQKLESDDRHAFFLGVLKKVRNVLAPRFAQGYVPAKKQPKSMHDVLNMFEHLNLEEPSEAFEQAPNVAVAPLKPEDADADYKAERIDSLQESFLAFYLLLSDLNSLRDEVSRAWEGYKCGLIDLVAASITTNTAVDLARAMEEDLKDMFSKHGGADKMLIMYYHGQCMQAGTTESYKERPGDEMNFRMYKVADLLFWPAFILLSSFSDVIQPKSLPEMKPGFFGTYAPSSDRSRKSSREKFQEDKILLLELLPELLVLFHGTERTQAEDEFTRGFRIFSKTKEVPLWLAFAATLFLDIHHILRDEVDFCFKRLADTADYVVKSINQILEFHSDLKVENWPAQNDEVMKAFAAEIKYWIQDDPHLVAARQLKRRNMPEPFYLFRKHPWSCGLWKYYIQVHFQELSIAFVNAWGSIMFCGHLYNALQQEKLITNQWTDMDIVFTLQGTDTFFIGEPPTNPENYLKRFSLAIGASATSVSGKARKKKGIVHSKRGPQGFKELAPVLRTFRERFSDKTARFELRTEDVEKILEQADWEVEMDDEDRAATLYKDSDRKPGEKKAPIKKLTPSKLLGILRATLHAEIMELSFDYLLLHRFCWRLLRAVKDKCRNWLIAMYGPEYIEKENQLPFVVGYILMTATNTQRLGELMKVKKTDEVTSKVMMDAAEALQCMLDTDAGKMVMIILNRVFGVEIQIEEERK